MSRNTCLSLNLLDNTRDFPFLDHFSDNNMLIYANEQINKFENK